MDSEENEIYEIDSSSENESSIITFPCQACEKKFYTLDKLNDHLVTHYGKDLFQCDQCQICFKSIRHLNVHIQKRHEESSSEKSQEQSNKIDHQKITDEQKGCIICEQIFIWLKTTVKQKSGILVCYICMGEFRSVLDLHIHIEKNHDFSKEQKKLFPCHECQNVYSSAKSLNKHSEQHKPRKDELWIRRYYLGKLNVPSNQDQELSNSFTFMPKNLSRSASKSTFRIDIRCSSNPTRQNRNISEITGQCNQNSELSKNRKPTPRRLLKKVNERSNDSDTSNSDPSFVINTNENEEIKKVYNLRKNNRPKSYAEIGSGDIDSSPNINNSSKEIQKSITIDNELSAISKSQCTVDENNRRTLETEKNSGSNSDGFSSTDNNSDNKNLPPIKSGTDTPSQLFDMPLFISSPANPVKVNLKDIDEYDIQDSPTKTYLTSTSSRPWVPLAQSSTIHNLSSLKQISKSFEVNKKNHEREISNAAVDTKSRIIDGNPNWLKPYIDSINERNAANPFSPRTIQVINNFDIDMLDTSPRSCTAISPCKSAYVTPVKNNSETGSRSSSITKQETILSPGSLQLINERNCSDRESSPRQTKSVFSPRTVQIINNFDLGMLGNNTPKTGTPMRSAVIHQSEMKDSYNFINSDFTSSTPEDEFQIFSPGTMQNIFSPRTTLMIENFDMDALGKSPSTSKRSVDAFGKCPSSPNNRSSVIKKSEKISNIVVGEQKTPEKSSILRNYLIHKVNPDKKSDLNCADNVSSTDQELKDIKNDVSNNTVNMNNNFDLNTLDTSKRKSDNTNRNSKLSNYDIKLRRWKQFIINAAEETERVKELNNKSKRRKREKLKKRVHWKNDVNESNNSKSDTNKPSAKPRIIEDIYISKNKIVFNKISTCETKLAPTKNQEESSNIQEEKCHDKNETSNVNVKRCDYFSTSVLDKSNNESHNMNSEIEIYKNNCQKSQDSAFHTISEQNTVQNAQYDYYDISENNYSTVPQEHYYNPMTYDETNQQEYLNFENGNNISNWKDPNLNIKNISENSQFSKLFNALSESCGVITDDDCNFNMHEMYTPEQNNCSYNYDNCHGDLNSNRYGLVPDGYQMNIAREVPGLPNYQPPPYNFHYYNANHNIQSHLNSSKNGIHSDHQEYYSRCNAMQGLNTVQYSEHPNIYMPYFPEYHAYDSDQSQYFSNTVPNNLCHGLSYPNVPEVQLNRQLYESYNANFREPNQIQMQTPVNPECQMYQAPVEQCNEKIEEPNVIRSQENNMDQSFRDSALQHNCYKPNNVKQQTLTSAKSISKTEKRIRGNIKNIITNALRRLDF